MKCNKITLTLVAFLVVIAITETGFCVNTNRFALVIGNESYRDITRLQNPANDADDMAEVLEGIGFTVTKRINATRSDMREAIRIFEDQIRTGGVGLFFYAGHGVQVDGINYLVPIGANVRRKHEVDDECLRVSAVLGAMEEARNGLNIIILDACRNNPFRSFRSASRGLAKMDAPTGSIIAFATAPGSVADDGVTGNGLYTSKLLQHIRTPGLPVESLLKKVRISVMNSSARRQVPWESSSLTGDFYFVKKSEDTASKAASIDHEAEIERERARLERERRELERLKKELEKKKQLAAQKQVNTEKEPIQTASLNTQEKYTPLFPDSKEKKREGALIAFENDVIVDTNTGLQWVAGPNKDVTWDDARKWVKRLDIAGGGWRMPTKDELKTLYMKGQGKRNISSLFKVSGWWIWSGEKMGDRGAWGFNFIRGDEDWRYKDKSKSKRVFAVRSKIIKEKMKNAVNTGERYVAQSNGILYDTKTLLECVFGPDKDMNWHEARDWVYNLDLDGGGWRMPTIDELRELFLDGSGNQNLLLHWRSIDRWIWSGDKEGFSSAWDFSINYGSGRTSNKGSLNTRRAFAVRSRGEG